MIRQASPHLSMLETNRQTDCIHDSSMHKTDTAGAMQHDTTQFHSVSYFIPIKKRIKKKKKKTIN